MPPPKDNQGGRFPSTYGIYGNAKFTGALHPAHEPSGWWRSGPDRPWRCWLCHPPARSRMVKEEAPESVEAPA